MKVGRTRTEHYTAVTQDAGDADDAGGRGDAGTQESRDSNHGLDRWEAQEQLGLEPQTARRKDALEARTRTGRPYAG
jgi:hypothetical protein